MVWYGLRERERVCVCVCVCRYDGLNPPCPRFVNRITIMPMKATSSKTVTARVVADGMLVRGVVFTGVSCLVGWLVRIINQTWSNSKRELLESSPL
ncbi:uncharacterized protein EKO05_0001841 [Ascochyta rabiei]|uniref:uncharacterized protein n=1 Tax=Didymella rabiei TaxID=5454 RepID=UPI0021FC0A64|nr:uncharacterized protein EKO05_0001841 [Ascochyta rabiei]UPX11221.1 hypothetical protein EKO05_0001841 [Ascochyta rabiei]